MFVSEMFVQAFGLEAAVQLLGGSLYHYCPTGVNQFKEKGRWSQKAEPGAVIFFTNGTRAYHTGIVTEVTATRVKTIEGNTSGASGVVENGGGVCWKSYLLTDGKIMGYGLPDWSTVAPVQVDKPAGWVKDDKGWWYRQDDGSYLKSQWAVINHHWYYFGGDGYMLAGWQMLNGQWYYLEESGDYQGACWHEVPGGTGALERWYVG